MHKHEHVPKDELVSSREVCDLLNIDRSTLSRWVTAGKVTPAMRVGGSSAFLFRLKDVESLRDAA